MPHKDREECKQYRRQYQKLWYLRNSAKHQQYVRAAEWKRSQRVRGLINHMKDKPCTDCGGKFPAIAMDFDHVRGDKVQSISRLVAKGFSLEKIQTEIMKCDVVCSNCHRVRTSQRLGIR